MTLPDDRVTARDLAVGLRRLANALDALGTWNDSDTKVRWYVSNEEADARYAAEERCR